MCKVRTQHTNYSLFSSSPNTCLIYPPSSFLLAFLDLFSLLKISDYHNGEYNIQHSYHHSNSVLIIYYSTLKTYVKVLKSCFSNISHKIFQHEAVLAKKTKSNHLSNPLSISRVVILQL